MPSLDFGDNPEEVIVVLKQFALRVHDDLYEKEGGVVNQYRSDKVSIQALEKERATQHKANTRRLNIIIAILVMLSGYVGIVLTLIKK